MFWIRLHYLEFITQKCRYCYTCLCTHTTPYCYYWKHVCGLIVYIASGKVEGLKNLLIKIDSATLSCCPHYFSDNIGQTSGLDALAGLCMIYRVFVQIKRVTKKQIMCIC